MKESEGASRQFDSKKLSTKKAIHATTLQQNEDKLPKVSVMEKNDQEKKSSTANESKQISNIGYEEDGLKESDSICKKDCTK